MTTWELPAFGAKGCVLFSPEVLPAGRQNGAASLLAAADMLPAASTICIDVIY